MSAKLVNALWQLYQIKENYWQAVKIVSEETRIPLIDVISALDNLIDSRYA